MVRRDERGEYVGLGCDTCPTMAPDSAAIIAGHGLVNIGWYCSGGTHICPSCPHPTQPDYAQRVVDRSRARRDTSATP